MIKVGIIDDEPLARKRVKKLIKQRFDIEVSFECGNVENAISQIDELKPDIIFLDIQMKSKNGFDVLDKINFIPIIVFITAYDKYAVRAFEYTAFDYLMKPFKEERFFSVLNRAISLVNTRNLEADQRQIRDLLQMMSYQSDHKAGLYKTSIPIKLADKTYFIPCESIEYIKASGYYAEIVEGGKKHILRQSLTELIKVLDPSKFIRIHRSSIINTSFLKEIISVGFGDVEIKMSDHTTHRVSKTYKGGLFKLMGMN
ncbi:MAG: LytTR family DNA-binding domain-containing protein [Fulvivirga sp.]|uniref:LytR/AlgR family response regulator transcription factor n=1 Tax=Fulvivirga sp. TaxID=1931237 RepID=UPI0032ECF4F7